MRLVSLLNTTVVLSLASAVVLVALFIYLFIFRWDLNKPYPAGPKR
jgi:hypothetical protein